MIHKITNLGEGNYQLDDNDLVLDRESIVRLATERGGLDQDVAQAWVDNISTTPGELKVEAATGVIVGVYEVDYDMPLDPSKETQALAGNLDDVKDFVTQYVFPSTDVEDVIIGLRSEVFDGKQKRVASSDDWRDILNTSPAFKDPAKFPKGGPRREYRDYRCLLCGHEKKIQTNHIGTCYDNCESCSWKSFGFDIAGDKTMDYGGRAYRKFEYVGTEV